MKLNPNLKLWEVGDEYMIVNKSEEKVNLSNVYSLNETAAFLWQRFVGVSFKEEDLIECLFLEYEVDKEVVKKDVEVLVKEWRYKKLILDE